MLGALLDDRQQRGVVVSAVALRAQGAEHLLGQARGRQRNAEGVAGLERDVQVLVVQVDPEAGREVVLPRLALEALPFDGTTMRVSLGK